MVPNTLTAVFSLALILPATLAMPFRGPMDPAGYTGFMPTGTAPMPTGTMYPTATGTGRPTGAGFPFHHKAPGPHYGGPRKGNEKPFYPYDPAGGVPFPYAPTATPTGTMPMMPTATGSGVPTYYH